MSERAQHEVTREAIDEIVRVVVERVSPRRVVLFGSAARGGDTPADVDLMVVVDEGADRRAIAGDLYRAMFDAGIGIGVDFVVATQSGFDRHRETAGLVYRDIARDGREVYVAA